MPYWDHDGPEFRGAWPTPRVASSRQSAQQVVAISRRGRCHEQEQLVRKQGWMNMSTVLQ